MIFSIRNLGFELGSLLLEGWAAFAARVVCAALLRRPSVYTPMR